MKTEASAPIASLFTMSALPSARGPGARARRLPVPGEAWHIRGLIQPELVEAMRREVLSAPSVPVGPDGILSNFKPGTHPASWRSSSFSAELASHLWSCLPSSLLEPRAFSEHDRADHDGHSLWNPVGVNALHRFIRYEPGSGHLVGHYDAPYIESEARRTLFSLVVYLSDNESGETRFLRDAQDPLPFAARDFSDWSRNANADEVLLAVTPLKGDALLFEHRMLHDGAPVLGQEKLILRTDLVFERTGAPT
ncbi:MULTISPECIES: 2OG-Fe(II) oxygenase [unclassified Variovorax]|uniref:2OG-Fe(II) oxygenase n=1 Tax=unclassified Variovorax TaxID=663243 RepID=UPI00076BE882|nr:MULTISPECIES: 2OG-Fe(II) oxygenase [unclassified Variovorax]KWT98131.1 hypothetical protein APY03_0802 [Variovorax sp. WDL1]PNG50392.1 hypothetical protein CHC06_06016 [Variovorax sp. B2]PNG51265.1 hypothetical protein CHC07_05922 [Variovorax sp. B4]VTU43139.1 hypothetical protein SRS16P1_00448 [Variovorax sp. SRS16]VTU43170.1 hypothetical protein E5P1_00445 [Variovorax sp. PBL-E5]